MKSKEETANITNGRMRILVNKYDDILCEKFFITKLSLIQLLFLK
jgi:hypothetical protein